MTEWAMIIFSVAALLVAVTFALIGIAVAVYSATRVYPYLKSFWTAKDGRNYVHPDTGEAVTFEEALKAEEEIFGGGVPYADWSNAVTRNRH